MGISPKFYSMMQLEFELFSYDITVQYVTQNAKKIPFYKFLIKIWRNGKKRNYFSVLSNN